MILIDPMEIRCIKKRHYIEVTGYFEILFIRVDNVDEDSFYDEYRDSLLELN